MDGVANDYIQMDFHVTGEPVMVQENFSLRKNLRLSSSGDKSFEVKIWNILSVIDGIVYYYTVLVLCLVSPDLLSSY